MSEKELRGFNPRAYLEAVARTTDEHDAKQDQVAAIRELAMLQEHFRSMIDTLEDAARVAAVIGEQLLHAHERWQDARSVTRAAWDELEPEHQDELLTRWAQLPTRVLSLTANKLSQMSNEAGRYAETHRKATQYLARVHQHCPAHLIGGDAELFDYFEAAVEEYGGILRPYTPFSYCLEFHFIDPEGHNEEGFIRNHVVDHPRVKCHSLVDDPNNLDDKWLFVFVDLYTYREE